MGTIARRWPGKIESRTPPKRSQGPQRRSTPSDPASCGASSAASSTCSRDPGSRCSSRSSRSSSSCGGGSSDDERAALEAAGFTLQSFPALPNKSDHSDVPTLETKPKWNSSPPTSGPHYGVPAVWDFYDEPVPLVQTVHNLEHGGVVIHYGPQFPKAEVEKIREWYVDDPNGLVVAPLAIEQEQGHALGVDRAGRLDRHPRPGPRLARDRHEVRQGRVRRLRRGAPVQGPRAAPARAVSTRQLAVHPPGWRNWQTRST